MLAAGSEAYTPPSKTAQELSPGVGKIAKQLPNKKTGGVGKNSANYWSSRLFKPVNSRGEESPHYSFRTLYKGRRGSFTTGTGNKEAAAKTAAAIYTELLTIGWDATLAKRRTNSEPDAATPSSIASVGEWITAARKVSEANDATFNCYGCSLRKIVGDILAVKRSSKRFGPKKGGAAEYRAKIDGASLEVLTPEAVQKWRLKYVKDAKNPAQERSRMNSCNSTIRQARSLFAEKVSSFIPELRLPDPVPFDKVKFYPRQNAQYFSRIDARSLIQTAREELAESDPSAFLAMLLALSAGLRKGEIDSLQWHQVDFVRQVVRVESTDFASLKTESSRNEVPIDENVVAILRGFHAMKKGSFILEGEAPQGGIKKWGQHYRAAAVFDRLTTWLRKHGVSAKKPLHELRKELGALVTAEYGIYAASRVLRHSDVSTTARHYSDLKKRPVVNVGSWLLPDNVTQMNQHSQTNAPKTKKA